MNLNEVNEIIDLLNKRLEQAVSESDALTIEKCNYLIAQLTEKQDKMKEIDDAQDK